MIKNSESIRLQADDQESPGETTSPGDSWFDYVLTKPLKKQDLAAAIRAVLDTRSEEAKRTG